MIEEIHSHLQCLDDFNGLVRRDIHLEPLQTLEHSEVYRIRVDSPPSSLILKMAGTSDVAGLAERERRFYRHIAPRLPGWLVADCVLAVDGDQTGMLFIEDLSGSHQPASAPGPSRVECRCFVEAIATLHGLSGSPTIQSTWTRVAGELPAGTIEQRLAYFEMVLGSFVDMIRGRVDRDVERFLTGLSELEGKIQGATTQANVLVHGDAHFANAFFSARPNACLIDWGMPMIGFGEIDLAHALALNLPRDLRREWELEMINVYLEQMARLGSSIDQGVLLERYRLGVLYSFMSPIVWWRSGVPDTQWWPALRNSLDAARDLGLMS